MRHERSKMPQHNTNLDEFQNRIGYQFNDINMLKNALTHSSYANEIKLKKVSNNERLEFLGDAVLELTSSDYIYRNNQMSEGEMSRLRASIVCEPTLTMYARGRDRDSIISDACEALIGSIYIDGGFAKAKEFIEKFILNDLENKKLFYDSKTILQEVVQAHGLDVEYEQISEVGPEHDKTFVVSAKCGDLFHVQASGHTKKAAQQKAAYEALLLLKKRNIDIKPKGKK